MGWYQRRVHGMDQDGNFITDGKFFDKETVQFLVHESGHIQAGDKGSLADAVKPELFTSDDFLGKNFSDAIASRDFTLVFFHVDWSDHCQHFGPLWNQVVDVVSEKMLFPTPAGQRQRVTLLKMNCASRFRDTCRDLGIASFPTLRLYKRSGSFVPYADYSRERSSENIISFLKDYFSQRLPEQSAPRKAAGCEIQGHLNIPRVQGEFYLTVGPSKDGTPNPDLVNMSHVVEHVSFNDAQANFHVFERLKQLKAENVPTSFIEHLTALDGKKFVVDRADLVPQHFLKVVNTKIGKKKRLFQITHAVREMLPEDGTEEHFVPRVRFAYDFSPLQVTIQKKGMPWYDFVTSFVAIIGGSYALVQLGGGAADSVYLATKTSAKRL